MLGCANRAQILFSPSSSSGALTEDREIASALHLALWESFIQRGARVRDAHRQRSYGALTPTLSQRAREWRM